MTELSLENLRNQISDTAKDIRLNLSSVLVTGESGLNSAQIWGTALAVGYALKHAPLVHALIAEASDQLNDTLKKAAQTAAALMAMNNVYYRALHLIEDKELSALPARLRMNGLANSGIIKADFELMCLAISALNGCGMCLHAHAHTLKEEGVTLAMQQHALKIAAVMNAAVTALSFSS